MERNLDDLFLEFDENKLLIAKRLSRATMREMFMLVNDIKFLDSLQLQELWKLIAMGKYSNKKLRELENMLTSKNPEVVEQIENIDYFRLMLADYITTDAQDESIARQRLEPEGGLTSGKGTLFSNQFQFLFEKSKEYSYDTHTIRFTYTTRFEQGGPDYSNYHTMEFEIRRDWTAVIDSGCICNLLRFVIMRSLQPRFYQFMWSIADGLGVAVRTDKKYFSMLFRIIYNILQIPGVSLKFEY